MRRQHAQSREIDVYRRMHAMQTVGFVRSQRARYGRPRRNAPPLSLEAALGLLGRMRDDSDPDLRDQPQSVHAYQTAERLRSSRPSAVRARALFDDSEWEALPSEVRNMYHEHGTLGALYGEDMDEWLPLVGLIHDCGKILALTGELPQWAVVGDTFPVGCAFDPANVLHDRHFWRENPDWALDTSPYCDPIGPLYARGGGLEQLLMSWGHDEYLARVLERHPGGALPPEAIYVVRFHSFYPWHTPPRGAARGYAALASPEDWRRVPLLRAFQRADLYSKDDDNLSAADVARLLPRYRALLARYVPGELQW